MDIITIIEKCVELSVRRDSLNKKIDESKRSQYYAKIEGDIAFEAGDFQAEKGYNNSASNHLETQESAEKELAQVEEKLKVAQQAYTEAVQSLDKIQLKEASIKMTEKKEATEREVEDLTQRRNWANSEGDKAFASKNYQDEKRYNDISSSCNIEIESIKPKIPYYKSFITDLENQINKDNNNFGPNGPSGPAGPLR